MRVGVNMTLFKAEKGKKIRIVHIRDKNLLVQAIRLGLYEGAIFTLSDKLPGGPVILNSRLQEIAVGRKIAENIIVEEHI